MLMIINCNFWEETLLWVHNLQLHKVFLPWIMLQSNVFMRNFFIA